MASSCSRSHWQNTGSLCRLASKQGSIPLWTVVVSHLVSSIRGLEKINAYNSFSFLVGFLSDRSCCPIWCNGGIRNISKKRPVQPGWPTIPSFRLYHAFTLVKIVTTRHSKFGLPNHEITIFYILLEYIWDITLVKFTTLMPNHFCYRRKNIWFIVTKLL